LINLAALTLLMLLQPIGGWISDQIGRKRLLVFFGFGALVYTWVLITELPRIQNPWAAFAMLAVGFVILTGYTSINAVVKAQMFPQHIRALGVGLGYALANSALGGTAPMLYKAAELGDHVTIFVVYVTAVVFASLLVYMFALRNHGPNWLDDPEAMEQAAARRSRPRP
jgi:MHS family alpha-ketoglutarate permease-like MFS transporter